MCNFFFFFKMDMKERGGIPATSFGPIRGGWWGGGTLIGRLRNWTTSLSFWWMGSISERDNDI